jgi:hypothetical protein
MAMAKKWALVLAVVLGAAATGARAQPPSPLPMPAQLARPDLPPAAGQVAPAAPAPPAVAAPPAGVATGGPGCAGGCCAHEQVSCLKRFCNWITYHPLTRGCECVCGCGCCSDCCGYHGFQPIYTYFILPCQEAPYRYGLGGQPGCDCNCGHGHGLLSRLCHCNGAHGAPIVPPGLE